MFLAIVMDSYCKEMTRVEEIPVEYSLFYDVWLSVLDTWRFRWLNSKKWALAHILSTTISHATVLRAEECLLRVVRENHPQVTVTGNNLEFNDPVFGNFVFSEHELRAYFRHVKSMDVLWDNGITDHDAADIAENESSPLPMNFVEEKKEEQ